MEVEIEGDVRNRGREREREREREKEKERERERERDCMYVSVCVCICMESVFALFLLASFAVLILHIQYNVHVDQHCANIPLVLGGMLLKPLKYV